MFWRKAHFTNNCKHGVVVSAAGDAAKCPASTVLRLATDRLNGYSRLHLPGLDNTFSLNVKALMPPRFTGCFKRKDILFFKSTTTVVCYPGSTPPTSLSMHDKALVSLIIVVCLICISAVLRYKTILRVLSIYHPFKGPSVNIIHVNKNTTTTTAIVDK